MKTKQKFTQEFKQQAVDLYGKGEQSARELAQTLGIGKSTPDKWISDAKKNDGKVQHRGSGNYSSDEVKEIAKLKKQLKDTQDALEILKKAISILND